MKKLFLFFCTLCTTGLFAQSLNGDWQIPFAMSDSATNNRNVLLSQTMEGFLLLWEQDVDSVTTRLCYRYLTEPVGTEHELLKKNGVRYTNPKLVLSDLMQQYDQVVVVFQADEGADADLGYVILHGDGSASDVKVLSEMAGNDTHVSASLDYVTWENNGSIFLSYFNILSNGFTLPFTIATSNAHFPCLGYTSVKYITEQDSGSLLVEKFFRYNGGTDWEILDSTSNYFEGVCDNLSMSDKIFGMETIALEQQLPGQTSGLVITSGQWSTEYKRSPEYNYKHPAVSEYMLAVKGGLYFLAFESDSLTQTEVLVQNPFTEYTVNISNWPGEDIHPQLYAIFIDYNTIRQFLIWESQREGHSTLYGTYIDYIFGSIGKNQKAQDIRVWPVPFTDELNIELHSLTNEPVSIFDVNGALVDKIIAVADKSGMAKASWKNSGLKNISLKPGTYIVKARSSGYLQEVSVIKK